MATAPRRNIKGGNTPSQFLVFSGNNHHKIDQHELLVGLRKEYYGGCTVGDSSLVTFYLVGITLVNDPYLPACIMQGGLAQTHPALLTMIAGVKELFVRRIGIWLV